MLRLAREVVLAETDRHGPVADTLVWPPGCTPSLARPPTPAPGTVGKPGGPPAALGLVRRDLARRHAGEACARASSPSGSGQACPGPDCVRSSAPERVAGGRTSSDRDYPPPCRPRCRSCGCTRTLAAPLCQASGPSGAEPDAARGSQVQGLLETKGTRLDARRRSCLWSRFGSRRLQEVTRVEGNATGQKCSPKARTGTSSWCPASPVFSGG